MTLPQAPAITARRRVVLLGLVLVVALLHALAQARVRPLYQVSDEMAYLRAAQVRALADAPLQAHRCIAPPDGELFALGEGGKAGFRALTAWQLRLACRGGGETLPLFALRAWQALALPLVALAAWVLAWQLSGSTAAALAAGVLVAIHPIAAKYAGGVTPDAWANAFSAWALVAFSRIAAGRHRWWDLVAMTGCTLAGLLWKDTTHFLVILTAVAAVVVCWRWWRGRAAALSPRRATLAAVAGGVGLAVILAWAIGRHPWTTLATPYLSDLSGGAQAAMSSPMAFLRAVLDDMLVQAAGFAASAVLSLYRPLVYTAAHPWQQPLTPWAVAVALAAISGLGAAGAMRALVGPTNTLPRLPGTVVAGWALALVLCAAQPSVRLVLLDVTGMHQGRWLLPMLAPAAAFVGIGLAALVRGAATVPVTVVIGLASVWVVLLDMVRHYYLRLPDLLATPVLFTRPTGDIDVGDRAIVGLIVATLEGQSALVTWGILVLLAAATLGLAWVVAQRDPPPAHHV